MRKAAPFALRKFIDKSDYKALGLEEMKHSLTCGSKAYIDSFNDLIACRVLKFVPADTLVPAHYRVKITAKTGRGYVRGALAIRPVSAILTLEQARKWRSKAERMARKAQLETLANLELQVDPCGS